MEQTVAVQAAGQPTLRTLLGTAEGRQAQGDAFAMIFQQMMGQGDAFGAILEQMAGTRQDAQEDGVEMGMQMAAEFLLASSGVLPQSALSQLQELLGQAAAVGGQGRKDTAAQNPALQALAAEDAAQEGDGSEKQTAEGFYKTLESAWKEPETGLGGQLESESAVREARRLLSEKPKAQAEGVDIEKLQADVDAKRFVPASAAQKRELPMPEVDEIAKQLKTGILENTARGKNEFVVKLKPDGLGEITVRLSEDKSRISLSIITSSPQVARLITNEVAALQNALRPLHAEVQQIVVNDGHSEGYAADHGLADQGQQSQQQFAGRQHTGGFFADAEENEFGTAAGEIPAAEADLDTYI